MHMAIGWEYIAGFFDGEGCVYRHQGRVSIAIYQARRNNRVLRAIRAFVLSEGIACHLNHTHPRTDCFKPTRMSVIQIRAVESAKTFLRAILPHLHVKKAKVKAALAHLDNTAFRTREAVIANVERACADYLNGMSAVAAAKKNGTSWKTLKDKLVADGIEVRGASASKKLWWSTMPKAKRQKICANLEIHKHPPFNGRRAS